ncbi:hypothetical protein MRX96_014311 [Rhipicephalus microplus]
MIRSCSVLPELHRSGFCSVVLFPWRTQAIGLQVPKSALRTPLRLAMDLTAIAHPASGDALPLNRGWPTSALRAAWISKRVLYHLHCANGKLEFRIPQLPLQSDCRCLQAHSGILLLQWLAARRSSARGSQTLEPRICDRDPGSEDIQEIVFPASFDDQDCHRRPPASYVDDDEAVSLISAMLFPLYQAKGWDYRRGDLDDFSVGCDGEEQLRSDPAPA